MVWRREDPEGNEAGKIRFELVPYTRGRGLDLGCGPNKAFPHFIGVDNGTDSRLFNIAMKPDVPVDTCERLPLFGSGSMDFVFSSHLLEHIQDYQAALKEWWRLIKQGGHLCLYLPHRDLYPNIGQLGSNPDHKWDFAPDMIVSAMKEVGYWDLVRNEDRSDGTEYSFFQVYRKRSDKHLYSHKAPKPAKRAAVVRYGAYGDLIQASSILPGLKEQGYHVTVYTVPKGHDVVKHDPHIDTFVIQDHEQVPNAELPAFWEHESKKYDRWINLSESVEGTWLSLPGRTNAIWPAWVRTKYMDVNYLEFQHDLANVPLPIKPQFFATQEEKAWARSERKRFGGDYFVMYVLAGSSVHKVWPHMDTLFARFMLTYPGVRIVTVGDEACQMIEAGWENESRVVRKAGKYTIRETLSLLAECDLVIGPETGVMNAAAMLPMPKVMFLSHSSANNLTKGWQNTISLEPKVDCFPCHRMHYDWSNCRKDESTGTAACQVSISVDQAWDAVCSVLHRKAA